MSPKNRVLAAPDGEPGLNWLCAGLKAFFAHAEGPMREMAGLLARGLPASGVMGVRKAIPRGGPGRPRGRAR